MNCSDPTHIYDRIDHDDDELLAAIAQHGGRLAVLRQLESGPDPREMTARDIAVEKGITRATIDDIAEAFADAWAWWYGDVMGEDADIQAGWAHHVETKHGGVADAILADAGRFDEVRDR